MENYAQTCTTLCELPLSHGEMSAIQPSGKFSAYHYCKDPKRIDISIFLDNDYQETSLQLADLVEEGSNILTSRSCRNIGFCGY